MQQMGNFHHVSHVGGGAMDLMFRSGEVKKGDMSTSTFAGTAGLSQPSTKNVHQ